MLATQFVGAIDQSTIGANFIVFDRGGATIASAQKEHRQIFSPPGCVEHDPAAVGITNQRTPAATPTKAPFAPVRVRVAQRPDHDGGGETHANRLSVSRRERKGWRNNGDASKWIEHEQIEIARHEHVRNAIDCQFEKLVVDRVSARDDSLHNRHELRSSREARDCNRLGFGSQVVEKTGAASLGTDRLNVAA
jgi:hypothetical protein